MPLCNIVKSVNKIKRLFRKYGVSNVNEAFLSDVSIFTVCAYQVRSPYTEHAASGLPNPINVDGKMFVQARDQQVTTRCPRIVTECLLTGSILIQMYVHV